MSEPKPLTEKQMSELMKLMKGADSVELKLTVPEANRQSTMKALGMDPLDAEIRQVVFFDTPDLALSEHGVVVRARRSQRKGDDTVVKLRPVVPDELPSSLRDSADFSVEVDALPGGFVCSGSLKARLAQPDVKRALHGEMPIRKLFTKAQRALLADRAPEGTELDDLAVLGPINVFKLRYSPSELGRRLVAEMWNYPDGSRVVELSTKCAPGEAFQVAAETKVFLSERGVDLTAEQQTKTRTAMELFSQELTSK
jgi:hypothetical protein